MSPVLPIALPPLQSAEHVNAATRRAGKLTQAILPKAFCGELVPTEAELARRFGISGIDEKAARSN